MENNQENSGVVEEKPVETTETKSEEMKTEAEPSAGETKKMTLTIKTPKEKETVQVDEGSSVKQLKDEVGKKFDKTNEQLCLIFSGKILKDPDTLAQHNVKDGVTVHLVIKNNTAPSTATATPTTATTTTSQSARDGNPIILSII
jgi:ubiquilin